MNTQSLEIHFLHSHVRAFHLHGRVAVPIDVLRASTTMISALANGAKSIHAFKSVEAARQFQNDQLASGEGDRVLLGGERSGIRIEGFDLGNSPNEYCTEVVQGRRIGFTTTNGTAAIEACANAQKVVLGSFVNLEAVTEDLIAAEKVALVCAGTDGDMTSEDILFAGAVAEKLCQQGFRYANTPSHLALNIARTFWQTACRQVEQGVSLAEVLQMTLGGKNLVELGMKDDIEFASQVDQFDHVPVQVEGAFVLEASENGFT